MELKDCLIFTASEEKGKIVIPRAAIMGLRTKIRRDYSANADKEYTVLLIDIEVAEYLGLEHRTERGQVGAYFDVPLSIMYPVHFGDNPYYSDNLQYYYQELIK